MLKILFVILLLSGAVFAQSYPCMSKDIKETTFVFTICKAAGEIRPLIMGKLWKINKKNLPN
jgi:hypothetical protein